jgi:triacylglycerol lipase
VNSVLPAVVFVHGILGFVRMGVPGMWMRYFRGLPEALAGLAVQAHFPQLPRKGTVAARSAALARFIERLPPGEVLLVGHSMGGLDCRHYVRHFDTARRVRAVATVGTPHFGTPHAGWLLGDRGPLGILARAAMNPGLPDLTPQAAERFNREVPDRPGVRYVSYAGCRPLHEMPLLFHRWAETLQREFGDNDGQVPVRSAAWGDTRPPVRADHWELVGWSPGLDDPAIGRPFAQAEFFRGLVAELLSGSL